MSGFDRPAGLWVAIFAVDDVLHVFEIDAIRSSTGVGGWLSEHAVCQRAAVAVGARLATKAQAFRDPMCPGCWVWMLEHVDSNVIYSPPGESSIAEPAAVGLEDLRGWLDA